jgi:hypothetical protein
VLKIMREERDYWLTQVSNNNNRLIKRVALERLNNINRLIKKFHALKSNCA